MLNTTPNKLYFYSALQLAIAVPSLICFFLIVVTKREDFAFVTVITVMLGLAGSLNSMVYFVCRKNAVNLSFNKEKASEAYMSPEISHNTQDSIQQSLAMEVR